MIACFCCCSTVAVIEVHFDEEVEYKEENVDNVGDGISLSFFTILSESSSSFSITLSWILNSSFSPSPTRNVRSSEEAHGACNPAIMEGSSDSRYSLASVVSPCEQKPH